MCKICCKSELINTAAVRKFQVVLDTTKRDSIEDFRMKETKYEEASRNILVNNKLYCQIYALKSLLFLM